MAVAAMVLAVRAALARGVVGVRPRLALMAFGAVVLPAAAAVAGALVAGVDDLLLHLAGIDIIIIIIARCLLVLVGLIAVILGVQGVLCAAAVVLVQLSSQRVVHGVPLQLSGELVRCIGGTISLVLGLVAGALRCCWHIRRAVGG
jgi:hypothetical protein